MSKCSQGREPDLPSLKPSWWLWLACLVSVPSCGLFWPHLQESEVQSQLIPVLVLCFKQRGSFQGNSRILRILLYAPHCWYDLHQSWCHSLPSTLLFTPQPMEKYERPHKIVLQTIECFLFHMLLYINKWTVLCCLCKIQGSTFCTSQNIIIEKAKFLTTTRLEIYSTNSKLIYSNPPQAKSLLWCFCFILSAKMWLNVI